MRKIVGVGNSTSLKHLKCLLLLFDQIAVVHAPERDWDFRPRNPRPAADLDWLRDRGIAFLANAHSNATVNIEDVKYDGKGLVLIPNPVSRPFVYYRAQVYGQLQ
jgi:hypothetical protein